MGAVGAEVRVAGTEVRAFPCDAESHYVGMYLSAESCRSFAS
jgi:hypothetical protein